MKNHQFLENCAYKKPAGNLNNSRKIQDRQALSGIVVAIINLKEKRINQNGEEYYIVIK